MGVQIEMVNGRAVELHTYDNSGDDNPALAREKWDAKRGELVHTSENGPRAWDMFKSLGCTWGEAVELANAEADGKITPIKLSAPNPAPAHTPARSAPPRIPTPARSAELAQAPAAVTLTADETHLARKMGLDPERVLASKKADAKKKADLAADAAYEAKVRAAGGFLPAQPKITLPNASPTPGKGGHGISKPIPTPKALTNAEREVALAMGIDPDMVARHKAAHAGA